MSLNNNNLNFSENEISLKELIFIVKEWVRFLKTKSKLILIISITFSILGYIYANFQKTTYTATLTYALEDDKGTGGSIGGAIGIASSLGIDLGSSGGGAFSSFNITELLRSRLVVEKTLLSPIFIKNDTTTLAEFYIELNNFRKKWSKEFNEKVQFQPNSNRKKFSFLQDSVLQILYKNLTNKEVLTISQKDKKISIITIEFISENELFAKLFCEKLASEVSSFYVETKSKKSKNNTEILQKQVDSVRAELNSSIKGFASATDAVYNLNPAYNTKGAITRQRQVDIQANTAILTQLVAQLELSKISLRKETPLIQIIDAPILPLQKNRIGRIKAAIFSGILSTILIVLFFILQELYKRYTT